MVIGLGKFKMEIDIAAETKKMKQGMRKVGDKSGIGASAKENTDRKNRHRDNNDNHKTKSTEDVGTLFDKKVMREAELLLSGQADKVEQLDHEFKSKVGSQKNENFVSAGNLQSAKKTATITFLKKGSAGDDKTKSVKIDAVDFKPTVKLPVTSSIAKRPPLPRVAAVSATDIPASTTNTLMNTDLMA